MFSFQNICLTLMNASSNSGAHWIFTFFFPEEMTVKIPRYEIVLARYLHNITPCLSIFKLQLQLYVLSWLEWHWFFNWAWYLLESWYTRGSQLYLDRACFALDCLCKCGRYHMLHEGSVRVLFLLYNDVYIFTYVCCIPSLLFFHKSIEG